VLQYYICENGEGGQPCYIVPFSRNVINRDISAGSGEELFLTLHMCIEGNCGGEMKVTKCFYVCASIKRILKLEDFDKIVVEAAEGRNL
jgi:hypothetical protein